MGSKDFQNNKIRSCSFVSSKGKDVLKAVPFYEKRNPNLGVSKSLFTKSWNSTNFDNKGNFHAGMGTKKPLVPVSI